MSSTGPSPKTASSPTATPCRTGNPERRQAHRSRVADTRSSSTKAKVADVLRSRPLHPEHPNAADPDLPQELGQSLPIPVQIRRLLLLRAHRKPISTGELPIPSPSATRNSAPFACAASASIPITWPTQKPSTPRSAARAISIASPTSKASSATPSSRT